MVFEDALNELHTGSIRHRHVFHSAHAHLDLRERKSIYTGAPSVTSVVDSGIAFPKATSSSLTQIDEHTFAFTFDMPRPHRQHAELPPTLAADMTTDMDVRGRRTTDHVEVSYRFICTWEPFYDDEESARYVSYYILPYESVLRSRSIEIPVMIQPDEQYAASIELAPTRDTWSEIPLLADDVSGLPYHCLVGDTLPISEFCSCSRRLNHAAYDTKTACLPQKRLRTFLHSLFCPIHT